MDKLAALLPLLALTAPALVNAATCVQFDTQWNLYAFGGSQDVSLGQSSSWGSPQVQPLTSSGRPPWTGNNTQCLLSQFNNAMYVLGGDESDFSKIYVFNLDAKTWSLQSTSSSPPAQLTRSASVLDHDTNVIFTFTNGGLTQLDLSSITKSASGSALAWEGVSNPSWGGGYGGSATAGQASNHIMYFGAPGTSSGQAEVFVVHYAYFQPDAQSFPAAGGSGSSFPAEGGQAVSVPDNGDAAPSQIVFVPSDFSNTYLVNHWTNPSSYASTDGAPYASNLINTTQTLPAPQGKDAQAAYAASPSSLVQITSGGDIYYIASAFNGGSAVGGASWSKLGYSLSGASGGSSASASASATGASGSASATGSQGQTSQASASAGGSGTASVSGGAAGASRSATSSGAAMSHKIGQVGVAGLMGAVGVVGAVMLGGLATVL